jgi:hypothetical protein
LKKIFYTWYTSLIYRLPSEENTSSKLPSLRENLSQDTIYTPKSQSSLKSPSPMLNEEIKRMSNHTPAEVNKIEQKDAEIQAEVCMRETGMMTELEIRTDEMQWWGVDVQEDLGREAAKTIIALDYYLKAWEKEVTTSAEFKVDESINRTTDSREVRTLVSPQTEEQIRILNNKSFNQKQVGLNINFRNWICMRLEEGLDWRRKRGTFQETWIQLLLLLIQDTGFQNPTFLWTVSENMLLGLNPYSVVT